MFVVHETLSNKRKLKIMQNPHLKPPLLSYGNFFFPKKLFTHSILYFKIMVLNFFITYLMNHWLTKMKIR